jgi:hypothetical protein
MVESGQPKKSRQMKQIGWQLNVFFLFSPKSKSLLISEVRHETKKENINASR